jgi:hypothetical protein
MVVMPLEHPVLAHNELIINKRLFDNEQPLSNSSEIIGCSE